MLTFMNFAQFMRTYISIFLHDSNKILDIERPSALEQRFGGQQREFRALEQFLKYIS